MGILHPIANCQNEDWIPNPKLFGDTIDVHMFEQDPVIFINANQDVVVDNDNYIWVSTNVDGLLRMDINKPINFKQNNPEGYGFDQLSIRKMYMFEDSLYFSADRGFLTYNPSKEKFHRYGKNDLQALSPYRANVSCMAFLSRDTILLGGKYGLTVFNKREDKIIKHLWDEDQPKDGASSFNMLHQLKVDPKDRNIIWGVGRKGLIKLDRRTWEREYFTPPFGKDNYLYYNYMTDFEIVGDCIYIVYIGDGRNLINKGNQVLKFDKKNNSWKVVIRQLVTNKNDQTFPSAIESIKTYGKYIFTSSRGYGVQLLDIETDEVQQTYFRNPVFYQMDNWKDPDRLLDNYAVGLFTAVVDNNGFLWASWGRDHMIKSKEPIFTISGKTHTHHLKLNTLYVNGIKNRKQNFQDHENVMKYNLNERERDLRFEVGLVNPSYENVLYEYKYNQEDWKETIEVGVIDINKLSPGNNVIKVKASVDGKELSLKEFTFYSTPRLHEHWWFIIGLLAIITFVIYKFYELTVNKIKDEEKIKTIFNKQIAEMEMEVLKAQMNPHFLFNSLNSIKHYSINKSKRETSQYITTFSHLLRQILQNSNAKIVSLAQELKAIELYVQVEKLRFENEFEYMVCLDPNKNEDTIFVPPMILQPFIENAIWHGLMLKEGIGKITLKIDVQEHEVVCEITDNGIGRAAAGKISKTKSKYNKQSLGTKITANRLKLAEKIYGKKSSFCITDLYDKDGSPSGTKVKVHLPRIYRNKETEI